MSDHDDRSTARLGVAAVGVTSHEWRALRAAAAHGAGASSWPARLQGATTSLDAMLRRHPEVVATGAAAATATRLAGLARRLIEQVATGDADPSPAARAAPVPGATADPEAHDPLGVTSRDVARRIGVEHRRAALSPSLLVEALGVLVGAQVDAIFAIVPDPDEARDAVVALVGGALFDAGLALDGFGDDAPASHPGRADLGSTATRADARRRLLGLDAATTSALRTLSGIVPAAAPVVVDAYLAAVREHAELAMLRPAAERSTFLVHATAYWQQLVDGAFDRPYALDRLHIGFDHARVGASAALALTGLAHQFCGLARGVRAEPSTMAAALGALARAVFFDATFFVDACTVSRTSTRPVGVADVSRVDPLLTALADPVVVVDGADRVRHANQALLDLVDRDAGAVHGLRIAELLAVDGIERVVAHARAASATGPRVVDLAGRTLRMTATALPRGEAATRAPASGAGQAADGSDEAAGAEAFEGADVAVLLVDVSELVRERAPAGAAEQRVDHLLASVSAVLWELDLESTTLRAVSSPVYELTGQRDVAFLGRPGAWTDLIPEPERSRLVHLCDALRPGETAEVDHRMRRADGTEIVVRSHLRRTTERAAATVAGVTYDVDVLRADQDRRLASIALLAGGVAHELNNALSAVYGNLALLGRSVIDPRAVRSVAAAEGAAARAADITTRLLSFAGRQVLRPEVVQLTELVREVVPVDGPPGGRVQVEVDGPVELWPCRVDRASMASALGELVVNAFEAMPDGGRLTVATRNVAGAALDRADESFGVDQVELVVRDTGIGMAPEARARATEPFFTTKAFGESTGLGLSTVYGFVTQSGGSLAIESTPGAGTTVRMRFPRDRTVHFEPSLTLRTDSTCGSVLLVDDDPMVREVTSELLGVLGVRVYAASSAQQALVLAAQQQIDVLLADIALGAGLDGIALINELRAQVPDLAVIVVSGHPEAQLGLDRIAGAYEYLRKPFTLDAIRAALRAVGRSAHADR